MFTTTRRSASVLVLAFSCRQAARAIAAGTGHQLQANNRAKIKKRCTGANSTQETSAFSRKEIPT
jgi:hypothetical protein